MSKKKNTAPKAQNQQVNPQSQNQTNQQAQTNSASTTQQTTDDFLSMIALEKEKFLDLFEDPDFMEVAKLDSQKIYDAFFQKASKSFKGYSADRLSKLAEVFSELEVYSIPKLTSDKKKLARIIFQVVDDIISAQQTVSAATQNQQATNPQATPQQAQASTASQQTTTQKKSLMDFAEKLISEKEHFSEMLNESIDQLRNELGLDDSTRAENVPNLEIIIDSLAKESMEEELKKLKGLYESSEAYEKKRFIKSLNSLLKFCLARSKNNFVRSAIPMFFDPLYAVTEDQEIISDSFIPAGLEETLKGFEAYAYIWTLVNQEKMNAALASLSAAIIKEGEDDASNSLTWVMRKMGVPVEKRVAFFQKVSEKNIIKSRKRLSTIMAAIGF